jgi:hypothetical protein
LIASILRSQVINGFQLEDRGSTISKSLISNDRNYEPTLSFEPLETAPRFWTARKTDTSGWSSYFQAMRRLAIAILVGSASPQLAAQTSDRTLERISLALERSPSVVSGPDSGEAERIVDRQILLVPVFEPLIGTPKLDPFEFVAPQFRGEFVRLALPVGEYVSDGMRALAAANRRRQEQAARRRVEADLKVWRERAPKSYLRAFKSSAHHNAASLSAIRC